MAATPKKREAFEVAQVGVDTVSFAWRPLDDEVL